MTTKGLHRTGAGAPAAGAGAGGGAAAVLAAAGLDWPVAACAAGAAIAAKLSAAPAAEIAVTVRAPRAALSKKPCALIALPFPGRHRGAVLASRTMPGSRQPSVHLPC